MPPVDAAPAYRSKPLRIACVQYDAKLGQIEANIRRVEEMLKDLRPGAVDLVVLPEMALSGYVFTSPSHVAPFLEPARIGPSALFSRALATRLRCHVVCGYPERPADGAPPDARGFNAAVVVGPTGEVLHNYRKSFLYETDKAWAAEGDGFSFIDLPQPLGRVSVGICMDINPKDFVAPWDAFELSNFTRNKGVDLLVLCANWLAAPPADPAAFTDEEADDDDDDEHPDGPSLTTLNYWAHRLAPLHDPPPALGPGEGGAAPAQPKETLFVACNRVGVEAGSKFVGTTTVLRLTPAAAAGAARDARGGGGSAAIDVLDCLGKREEMVLFVTVP